MTQPALLFTEPTPPPVDVIAQWVAIASNVQVAWIHAPQKVLGLQGKPGVRAYVYLSIQRDKQYGDDDYREETGLEIAGTITLTTQSTTAVFSSAQSIAQGSTLIFALQPGQPYYVAANTVFSKNVTLTSPYTGPSGTCAIFGGRATNLGGQRRLTIMCRAESMHPGLPPYQILERIRWAGRTYTTSILEDANLAYADAGEIRHLGMMMSVGDKQREISVAVMELGLNFAVNNTPVGTQAPGDAGDVIETVDGGTQEPGTPITIPGNGQVLPSPAPSPSPPPPSMNLVRINANQSPYSAQVDYTVVVDTSLGSVVVNLPVLSLGQWVTVTQDQATSLATTTVTINGPTGVQIAQPPPNNGTFESSYVMSGVESQGMSLTWYNGGSTGGYLLE